MASSRALICVPPPYFEPEGYETTKILLKACENEDSEELLQAIADGSFDVNGLIIIRNDYGPGAFHFTDEAPLNVAILRNKNIAKLLLEKGADVNGADLEDRTPLILAVEENACELAEILLRNGCNMMLASTIKAFSNAVNIYISPANNDDDLTKKEASKRIIEQILEYGCRMSGASEKMSARKPYYEVCRAIFQDDIATVKKILDNRRSADFDEVDDYQPSCFATRLGRTEILELLFDKGIDVEKVLMASVDVANVGIIQDCLDNRSQDISDSRKILALNLAAERGHLVVVKLLVNTYGFDPAGKADDGSMPVHHAIKMDHGGLVSDENVKVLDFLLNNKVMDLNIDDVFWESPLRNSMVYCHIYCMFLEHGADPVSSKDHYNQPTHFCSNPRENCAILHYLRKLNLLDPEFATKCVPNVFYGLVENWDVKKSENIQEYQKELAELRSIQISKSTSTSPKASIFDFMFLKPSLLARYSMNENLTKIYEENNKDFRNVYPHYGFVINYNFRNGARRKSLVDAAQDLLNFSIGIDLPDDIGEEIFQYFNDQILSKFSDNIDVQ